MTNHDLFSSVEAMGEPGSAIDPDINPELMQPNENNGDSALPLEIARQRSIWISMANGEQLHLRHFVPLVSPESEERKPGLGRRVFMLHGEAECGRVFYDNKSRGLAWYLAKLGFEVFVADLGGRGRSLVPENSESELTVHEIIAEAVPKFMQAIRENSVTEPLRACIGVTDEINNDIWIGRGFGAVLLSAAWARLDSQWRTVSQMVFFAGKRRQSAANRRAKLFVKVFCHPLTERLVNWKRFFPATAIGIGAADENVYWYRDYANWMNNREWVDPRDGFDYAAALTVTPLPQSLHFAAGHDAVQSNVQDVRNFIDELGTHDARLVVVDQIDGSKRYYNHLSMLLDPAAEEEIFMPLVQWLDCDSVNASIRISPTGQREQQVFGDQSDEPMIVYGAEALVLPA